jgi:cell division protease FtsH
MMADALMKYETITGGQIDQIMDGKDPDPPEGWQDSEPDAPSGGVSDTGDRTSVGGPAEQV